MKRPRRFASLTELAIEHLLDGESLERILPNLNGNESPDDILRRLRERVEQKEPKP